jgi:hypothetical protein
MASLVQTWCVLLLGASSSLQKGLLLPPLLLWASTYGPVLRKDVILSSCC